MSESDTGPFIMNKLPHWYCHGSHVSSTGPEDVQRFEPHLGHNWLSCGVFLVKSRHFGLPLAQTIRPNWQSLLAGGSVAIQTWSIYKSIPEETRAITVPSNFTLLVL